MKAEIKNIEATVNRIAKATTPPVDLREVESLCKGLETECRHLEKAARHA